MLPLLVPLSKGISALQGFTQTHLKYCQIITSAAQGTHFPAGISCSCCPQLFLGHRDQFSSLSVQPAVEREGGTPKGMKGKNKLKWFNWAAQHRGQRVPVTSAAGPAAMGMLPLRPWGCDPLQAPRDSHAKEHRCASGPGNNILVNI